MLRDVGKQSNRKYRLAAVSGLRHFWADLTTKQQRAVTAAERYADGEIRISELRAAAAPVGGGLVGTLPGAVAQVTHRVVANALSRITMLFLPVVVGGPVYTNPPFPQARAFAERGRPMMAILRDIFGNPFRPVALSPAWLTSTVVALARGIYEERAFDRMPVLADALQDAGCDNDDVLNHCRDEKQVHVRGCWVVDLVLGRK